MAHDPHPDVAALPGTSRLARLGDAGPRGRHFAEALLAAVDATPQAILLIERDSETVMFANCQAARELGGDCEGQSLGQLSQSLGLSLSIKGTLGQCLDIQQQGEDAERAASPWRVVPSLVADIVILAAEPSGTEPHREFSRDSLTGLPDRRTLKQRWHGLAQNMNSASASPLAVLFIDLDDFKSVNDRYGHVTGDRCLRRIGALLASGVRPDDLVVRYGGDEFVVLLTNVTSRDDALRAARRIGQSLQPPFDLDGTEFHMSASIGIVLSGTEQQSLETVIEAADVAMYRAKKAGPGHCAVFGESTCVPLNSS